MKLLAALLGLLVATLAAADIIRLKDGGSLEGNVKKSGDGWTVTSEDGTVTQVPAANVAGIELRSGESGAEAADSRLLSLRRSVENIEDLAEIISRFERYIESNPGSPAADAAKKDLATWRQRQEQGLVKVGDKWLSPQEKTALGEQSIALAAEARQLIKDGRVKQAEKIVDQILAVNQTDPAAQYLRGVIKFRQDDMPAARRAFEVVQQSFSNHVPTLNNLGVTLWRQNQHAASLNWYDQAMQVAPMDKDVLDNVAEALAELPEDMRDGQVAKRVERRFSQQDVQLQERLGKQGLYRWGAIWVDATKLEELKAAEKKVQEQLDKLAADFEATQGKVRQIEDEIAMNDRAIRRFEADSWVLIDGKRYQRSYPDSYYHMVEDNQRLARERDQQFIKLDEIRLAAKEAQKQFPTPKYSGTQKIIETEGAPIEVPSTQPTTKAN